MYKTIQTIFLLCIAVWATGKDRSIQFLVNKGQVTDQHYKVRVDIDAKTSAGGVTLYVGSGQLHYQWQQQIDSTHTDVYRLDVTLLNANKNAVPVFEEETAYYEHYYLPHTGADGLLANAYKKVTYKNVYPNIDWVLYTKQGAVKYDFIVHAGGNIADIQMQYNGAATLQLKEGRLVATTPFGSITEEAPYTYDAATGMAVNSTYLLKGNVLSFKVQASNAATLIIDPEIDWITYYGGTGNETDGAVTSDTAGNPYAAFTTLSSNIATTGAYQTAIKGNSDACIVKFDQQGNRKWATYYGDTGTDRAERIVADNGRYIYVGGRTNSKAGIATSGSFQPSSLSGGDTMEVFILQLDTSGNRQWATYYGYNGHLDALVTDAFDNLWCAIRGDLFIGNYTTSNAFLSTVSNAASAYACFNSSGNRLYGSFFEGSILSIWFDHLGNYYLGGGSNGANSNIVTTGAHQTTYGGGPQDGYVNKFNKNHSRLWGTYYGGNAYHNGDHETVHQGVCDAAGNVYITGTTMSVNNIATSGSFQDTFSNLISHQTGYVASFTATGARRWATYYGGVIGHAQATCIDIGVSGDIYTLHRDIYVFSTNLTTPNAYKATRNGGMDLLMVQWDTDGNRKYASFLGGTSGSKLGRFNLLNCSKKGKVYIASETSDVGMATTGAFQTSKSSGTDIFIAQWVEDTAVYIKEPFNDTSFCPLDTLHLKYGVTKNFNTNNSFSVQLSNASGSFGSPVTVGNVTANTEGVIDCVIPVNTPVGSGYKLRIIATSPVDTSVVNWHAVHVNQSPAAFSNSSNSPVCEGDTIKLNGTSSSTGITWAWTGAGSFGSSAEDTVIANAGNAHAGDYILTATLNSTGCSFSDTATVVIKDTPDTVVASSNQPVCATKTLTLNAGSATTGVSWSWTGPNTYSSNTQNPTVTTAATSSEAGSYIVTANLNGCTASDTTQVVVLPKPNKPTAGSNSPVCVNQNLELSATNITNAKYNWSGPALFSDTNQNAIRYQTQFAHAGTYYVFVTVNGCASDTDSVVVTVNTNPYVTVFPTPGSTVCKDEEVTFTSVANNAGSTPAYKWLVNNTPTGSTGATYKTKTLNNGDIVTCEMISTGTCLLPFTDTSNAITMTVQALLTPQVSITANPNHTLFPNEPVTFTATPTDAGNNPTYQWTRNGTPVGGATGAQWGANANFMSDGDEICAIVYSNYACPSPDSAKSNCITVKINVGVSNISKDSDINIYPNPVTNELHIDGATKGTEVTLYDVTGRTVYRNTITTNTHHINTRQLSAGSYVLVLTDKNGKRLQAKVNKW